MILADTSVWIDHFRQSNRAFAARLGAGGVAMHPMVRGELACGNLANRRQTLIDLAELFHAAQATHDEVLAMIEAHALHGRGLGFIDLHLLASCRLSRIPLLTRDKRLTSAAKDLGVAAN